MRRRSAGVVGAAGGVRHGAGGAPAGVPGTSPDARRGGRIALGLSTGPFRTGAQSEEDDDEEDEEDEEDDVDAPAGVELPDDEPFDEPEPEDSEELPEEAGVEEEDEAARLSVR